MNKMFIVVLIVLGINPSAFSQFKIQQPVYGGSACPEGTASVVFLNGTIKILLDQLVEESEGKLLKARCFIRIPVRVDAGYQVRQVFDEASGFANLPAGRKAKLELKQFVGNTVSQKITKLISGPVSQDFDLSNDLLAEQPAWSPCGAMYVDLTTEISVELAALNGKLQAGHSMVALDHLDFHVEWRSCQSLFFNATF